jgi:hypothetical protein
VRNLRHYVNVMRPTKAADEYGQTQGQPETLLANVPCSVETLSGRELELARATFGMVSYKVTMYGDPSKPIRRTDYLTMGDRRLEIADVKDTYQNGVVFELICGEAT